MYLESQDIKNNFSFLNSAPYYLMELVWTYLASLAFTLKGGNEQVEISTICLEISLARLFDLLSTCSTFSVTSDSAKLSINI